MNIRSTLLTLACTASLMAGSGQESAKVAIGPVAFQTYAEGTYFHISTRVTYAELSTQTPAMAAALAKTLKEAGIPTFGPLLIIQRGASEDRGKPFDQEVGILVPKGTKAFGEAKVRDLSPFPCATSVTSGDFAGEGAHAAFMTLFKAAGERGRIPTGEIREMLLFWEGQGSANNLMQVQIGLR